MKSRKVEAAILGIQISGVIGLVIGAVMFTNAVSDAFKDRDHYRALYQIEMQSTDILINQQMKRMSTLGLGRIHIEVPCDAERGLVHQLELEVVR